MSELEMIARRIFIMFLAREGVDAAFAAEEFDLILSRGPRHSTATRDSYFCASRVGRVVPAAFRNRAGRVSLYMTFENAFNHAAYELESRE